MSNHFFEIKNGNFVASEKNKVNNVNLKIEKRGEIVSLLGEVSCKAMLSRGVFPVIKHIPGHGRAKVDSHKALPIINASWETLKKSDFIPFKNLNNKPFGMTAHILYDCIDSKYPISLSSKALKFIKSE